MPITTTLSILVIEDELMASRRLCRLINENEPLAEIVEVCDSIASSLEFLENHATPQLIISDIQLADGVSFEIFKKISPSSPIIFTTAYNEYAITALKHNCVDYLLKPIKEEELTRAINKAKADINMQRVSNMNIEKLVQYFYTAQ
jgi:two-component system response regulator LytT